MKKFYCAICEGLLDPADYESGIHSEVCAEIPQMLEWTVKIRVNRCWVQDGFELDNETMHDIMTDRLDFATYDEVGCEVLAKPDPALVRLLQGFISRTEFRDLGNQKTNKETE